MNTGISNTSALSDNRIVIMGGTAGLGLSAAKAFIVAGARVDAPSHHRVVLGGIRRKFVTYQIGYTFPLILNPSPFPTRLARARRGKRGEGDRVARLSQVHGFTKAAKQLNHPNF